MLYLLFSLYYIVLTNWMEDSPYMSILKQHQLLDKYKYDSRK